MTSLGGAKGDSAGAVVTTLIVKSVWSLPPPLQAVSGSSSSPVHNKVARSEELFMDDPATHTACRPALLASFALLHVAARVGGAQRRDPSPRPGSEAASCRTTARALERPHPSAGAVFRRSRLAGRTREGSGGVGRMLPGEASL